MKQALALSNESIESHQIQILTHRETGERWVRIINVDRSRRTTLRLVLKRAGINASPAFNDDVENSGWSIRFAAAEITKLCLQSPESFDVHSEYRIFNEQPGNEVKHATTTATTAVGRRSALLTKANPPGPRGIIASLA